MRAAGPMPFVEYAAKLQEQLVTPLSPPDALELPLLFTPESPPNLYTARHFRLSGVFLPLLPIFS
jgi:hypothetical protein